jgi:hypothetical protein
MPATTSTSKSIYLYSTYAKVKLGSHGPSHSHQEQGCYSKFFFYSDCPCLKVNISCFSHKAAGLDLAHFLCAGALPSHTKDLDIAMLKSRFLLSPSVTALPHLLPFYFLNVPGADWCLVQGTVSGLVDIWLKRHKSILVARLLFLWSTRRNV